MSASVGVIFIPELEPEKLRDYVVEAERSGLDEVLFFEDCFRESGLAAATAALAWTERIRIGIGVLPMPFRNVALLAMEAATIDRLFPGRLRLGVGHGVQDWMAQVGARAASPLTLMREYVPALRGLLAGERLDVEGRYVTLRDVQLNWPPAAPLEVWAAGEGPKTLGVTGEVADGTILTTGTPPEAVRAAGELAAAGRAAAGRDGVQPLAVFVMAAFGEGAPARLERELATWGYTGDRAAGVTGSPTEVAEQLRAWLEAGASTVFLQPLRDEPDLSAFLADCAEVARLLR